MDTVEDLLKEKDLALENISHEAVKKHHTDITQEILNTFTT